MGSSPDSRAIANGNDVDVLVKPASNGKLKLLTLGDLDGRTLAARRARSLVSEIQEEIICGDDQELTASQRQLVQHAAFLGAMIESMSAQWLLGEPIDQATYSMLINTQRRVLAAL
jgi:hypothetical protein